MTLVAEGLISRKKGGSCTKIYPKTKFQDVAMFRDLCKFAKWPGWLEGSVILYELGGRGSIPSKARHVVFFVRFRAVVGNNQHSCYITIAWWVLDSIITKLRSWSLTSFLVQILRTNGNCTSTLCSWSTSDCYSYALLPLTRTGCPHHFSFVTFNAHIMSSLIQLAVSLFRYLIYGFLPDVNMCIFSSF